MSYVQTYNSLLTDLRQYLERGFTEESDPIVYEQLPRLITLGQRRVARDLKIQGFLKAVAFTAAQGVAVYRKPDRWRDTISMRIGGNPVFTRSYEYCRNYWPNEQETAQPEFFADYDFNHWLIVPTPSVSLPAEVLYYEQPRLIDEDFQTNWMTEYAPDMLLYSCLLEAQALLKNDKLMANWQNMYNQAKASVNQEDLSRILDRAANRSEN